jgi:sugar lactone lactonase YvrE
MLSIVIMWEAAPVLAASEGVWVWPAYVEPYSDLPARWVYSIKVNAAGEVWCGTGEGESGSYKGGASKYTGGPPPWYTNWETYLRGNFVYGIDFDYSGYTWIATLKGVCRLKDGSTYWPPELSGHKTRCVAVSPITGEVWVAKMQEFGYNAALYRFNGITWVKYDSSNTPPPNAPVDWNINTMVFDREGNLWIGTDHGGASKFNLTTSTWTNYTIANSGILSNTVNTIAFDRRSGNVWFGTSALYGPVGGACKFDQVSQWTQYNPPAGELGDVLCITIPGAKRVWFGTRTSGAYFFDDRKPADQKWRVFNTSNTGNGLPDNCVNDIDYDYSGYIWFGTRSGGVGRLEAESIGETRTPPHAAFEVIPSSGDTDTNFFFDASYCTDKEDPLPDLEVRWDFEDDGIYDTSFTTDKTITHNYPTLGEHTIRLEVRDTDDMTDSCTKKVKVYAVGEYVNPALKWYFAEGNTMQGFDQFFCIQNPDSEKTAHVTITYMPWGAHYFTKEFDVNPSSRFTVRVNDSNWTGGAGPGYTGLSAKVEANIPIIAERPMYFNKPFGENVVGGHNVMGVNETSKKWYFAEGNTMEGFAQFFCIQNPDPLQTAHIKITYMPYGASPFEKQITVAPASRFTVDVSNPIWPGAAGRGYTGLSAKIESDIGIIAERPMYFDLPTIGMRGGHNVMGLTSEVNRTFYFAEGNTMEGFAQFFCIQNPDPYQNATVTITYMPYGASPFNKQITVGPSSRATIYVNDNAWPGGAGPGYTGLSAKMESDIGIIAERPMYFNLPTLGLVEGHNVMGATEPDTTFSFAEGNTMKEFAEFFCIQNPDPNQTATVTITYMPYGAPFFDKQITVGPSSRATIFVKDDAWPGGAGPGYTGLSARLQSSIPIVAERPIYFNYPTTGLVGGHNVIGSLLP